VACLNNQANCHQWQSVDDIEAIGSTPGLLLHGPLRSGDPQLWSWAWPNPLTCRMAGVQRRGWGQNLH
jgi:hypothetical protein